MKRYYIFSLVMVSCFLVIFQLGCGQQQSESSTTTTSTTTTTLAKAISMSSMAAGTKAVTYGGTRVQSVQGLKAQTNYTVSGYVYNADDNNSPVGNVEVWAGTTIVATTDASGAYSLLNVPGGEITFTAVPTSSASSIGIAVSVSTQAKNIDFYINYFNLADKGTVKGKITDSNGNGVASAKLICQSRKTSISAFYAMDRNHSADASGNYSIDDMLSGKVAVAAGKHGVGNVFSSVEGTLSTGSSLTVDLQIPSQETLSGSFSVPSGFSSWLFTIPPVSAVLSENYFITMPTYESTSTSFNVSVPINKTYTISLQIDTSDYKKMTQAIEQNISVTAGQAVSKNLTLLDVPASITLATTETTSTLTWEAPSMWKPDFYMVWGSLYQNIPLGTYNYWFAFTDKTTITIPKVFITLYSTQTPLVYAMKADGTIDFNALDLTKLYPTQVSGLRWSK